MDGNMNRRLLIAFAIAGLSAVAASAQTAKTTLDAAATALGATSLNSIQFSGWGSDYIFGQAYDGNSPWPRFYLPSVTVTIDYTTPAWRDDRRRTQVQNPPLGGGFQPLVGEQRQIWALSGTYAWDMVGQNAVPPAVERDMRPAVDGRMAQIWLTPHGFIKAAMAGNATTKAETLGGAKKTVISFTTPTKVKLEGILNGQNLVERIETWVDNPVLGDMMIEAVFRDYKDFGGVKFPTHILQREGGYPVLDLTITDVKPNAAAAMDVPANIRQAKPPAPAVIEPQKLSDGTWIIPGAAKSIAVEFRDHIVVVDAPETEARSIAVIDAIKKIIPGKPIRYVVNTHTHFDHAGGLRTYAAEGASIITQSNNVPYYEQVWSNPRTINPDRLARSGRKPVLEGLVGSRTLTDGSRTMVVYHYAGNMHNAGLLMVFLPKERILIEADSFNPSNNPNEPPAAISNLAQFYGAVERLKLDVEQIVPIHGRLVTFDDARKAIETYQSTQEWAK
jgi:glyoxylase-like metal-dependent hydrolase (beta-lactamase superfamily II)